MLYVPLTEWWVMNSIYDLKSIFCHLPYTYASTYNAQHADMYNFVVYIEYMFAILIDTFLCLV